jgi:hypothetical protein
MATITRPRVYVAPGHPGSDVPVKPRYDKFIGGRWVAPVRGGYSENLSPATGQAFTQVARSTPEDVELALDAAHATKDAWGETTAAERARILNKIADAMEAHLEMLAVAESWDNGKPVRETLNADLPLAIDHFRYFAGAIRAGEGHISEIDKNTVLCNWGLLRRKFPDLLARGRPPAWPNDLLLGEIEGCPFYIDREQYERGTRPVFLIDVAAGESDAFSLEGPEGLHFVARPGTLAEQSQPD